MANHLLSPSEQVWTGPGAKVGAGGGIVMWIWDQSWSQEGPKWTCFFYPWGRVWVQYLSFAVGHHRLAYRWWPTQFHSIYIYSVYIYVLFISKRVWGHYGELISPWPNRDISILFEDSTSVEAPPPMGGCMGGWVGWWVGSGQIT